MSEAEKEAPGFLARWSRRKLAPPETEAEPEVAPVEPPEAEAPQVRPAAACPIPGGPEIDLASLPKVEDLTLASDLGPFLRAGVPAALRNAALRRMWSLDPGIRDFINAVDYQWDFNTPGGLPHGFANELTGDVSKLLAQAIGDHFKTEPPPTDPDAAETDLVQAAAQDGDSAPATPGLPVGDPVPAADSPILAGPETSPLRLSMAEPAPVAVEAPAEPGLPRRRHGSALPG